MSVLPVINNIFLPWKTTERIINPSLPNEADSSFKLTAEMIPRLVYLPGEQGSIFQRGQVRNFFTK